MTFRSAEGGTVCPPNSPVQAADGEARELKNNMILRVLKHFARYNVLGLGGGMCCDS